VKVLFVYKLLTMGGVETVLRARLEGLPKHGIEAHAWFLFDGPGRVIFEDMRSQVHVGSTGLLREFLLREDFDLLSTIDTEEILPTVRRLRERSLLVIEAHTPYAENLEYLRFLGDTPIAAFFVPSKHQAYVVRNIVGKDADIRVMPNSLAEIFEAEIDEFLPKPPHPVVAWIGRLDDLKNWQEFIRIAKFVKEGRQRVEFWIVGRSGGEDISQDLYQRARRAKILHYMRWYRGLPYMKMPSLLDAVRSSGGMVVSTSKGDSFGMTVVEAMARACPVLVPSQGPFGEFIEAGVHGEMYQLGNIKEAATKIAVLLEDGELRSQMGIRGREHILRRYASTPSVRHYADELRKLFRQRTPAN
jgi:glycosyltransferase involved in cell wall biosynthesis